MRIYRGEELFAPEVLRQIQLIDQEILDEVVRICNENGLKYYLAGGTLLGAVRHQGPIPWDDDIDIYMPRADMEVLKNIMLQLPDDSLYHVECYENEPNYWRYNLHITKEGTLFRNSNPTHEKRRRKQLWIDVLALDQFDPKTKLFPKLFAIAIISFRDEILHRSGLRRRKTTIKHRLVQLPFKLLSTERLYELTARLMQMDNDKQCDYYANWTGISGYPKCIYKQEWFEPSQQLLYNGKYYRVPGNWDKLLTVCYGKDYMLPPEKDKCIPSHRALEIGF